MKYASISLTAAVAVLLVGSAFAAVENNTTTASVPASIPTAPVAAETNTVAKTAATAAAAEATTVATAAAPTAVESNTVVATAAAPAAVESNTLVATAAAPVAVENNTVAATAAVESNTPAATTASATEVHKAVAAAATTEKNLQATLKLSSQNDKLYAHVVITQMQNSAGKIHVEWKAPANSHCGNSNYALNYQHKKFHTKAYRTLIRQNAKGQRRFCEGTWQARIVDENNKVLAEASFDVTGQGAATAEKAKEHASNNAVINKTAVAMAETAVNQSYAQN